MDRLGLCGWLGRQCSTLGLQQPTPVQEACVPAAIQGKDVIGCAPTGSGKTAAFALPVLHLLSEDPFGIFALVLTPTRELAFQIGEQFSAFGAPMNIRCEVIVGGMDMMKQASVLNRRPHVLVCTPGRLVDHIRSTSVLDLSRVRVLVLDEADRLLDAGFGSEMGAILSAVSSERQTLLFSATMTKNLRSLRELSLGDAFCFEADAGSGEFAVVEQMTQQYVLMPAKVKDTYLVHLLRQLSELSTIVFTASCKSCELIQTMITGVGLESVALHSRLSQAHRLRALNRFKSSRARILVATDVGSRGLDIPKVELVLNYNLPAAAKEYLHRVGRTARAGRAGRAISLVTQYDVELVQRIEDLLGKKLEAFDLNEDEVLEHFKEVLVAKRKARMEIVEKTIRSKASRTRKNRKRNANWASITIEEASQPAQ